MAQPTDLRRCLVPPIPEVGIAAGLLGEAADALLHDDLGRAREQLRQADMPVLFDYARRIMGPLDPDIHRRRRIETAAPKLDRSPARMPAISDARRIYARDGWHCRFCGCRVVLKQARDRMRTLLPGAIPWSVEGYHAAFYALTATLDHVVPHADGGGSGADNIVTTCWPCNFGRGGYSLAEFGLIDPRLHPAVVDAWDGLGHLGAASRRPRDKMPADAWFASIDRIQPTLSDRILAFVESCRHLDVFCSIDKVMRIRMRVEGIVVDQFGVEPNGEVSIPWWIGEQKASFRNFAGALAEAIPGAAVRESPKHWIVDKNGRKVHVLDLLEASTAVRAALAGLHAALKKASPPSG